MLSTCYDPYKKRWNGATADRLPKHDLYFGTPVNKPTEGLPIGDGDTGSLLWQEKEGLHVHINKCDLWQDAPPGVTWDDACYCSGHEEELSCLKHAGELTLRFGAPVFEYLYQQRYETRLSLADATARIDSATPFSDINIRAFAEASHGVTVLRCRAAFPEGAAPELTLSRWGSRTLWRWYCQQKFVPEVGLEGTESFAEGSRLFITQELNATKFCIGLAVSGGKIEKTARRGCHSAAVTLASAEKHDFTVYYTVKTGSTVEEAKAACQTALDEAEALGEAALYETHRAAWETFWNRSGIAIADDYLENIWYFNYYIMNSESRGAYPPHFTGGLWFFYHDYIPWVYYFHYNMQHLYAPLDAAGHGELAAGYYRMRRDSIPCAKLYAQIVKHKNGAFFHDVTDRFGRGADYDSLNCTPASQMAMQMYRHWRYTGDGDFLQTHVLPMMQCAAEYYLDILTKEADGLYHLHGTTAYEGNQPTDDTLTDLVMIRAMFSAYLPYCEAGTAERLRDVLDHLPGPILLDLEEDTDWDGERFLFGIGKGRKPRADGKIFGFGYRDGAPVRKLFGDPDSPKRGYGFPDIELSPLYPAGIFGLKDKSSPLFDVMYNEVMLHKPADQCGQWEMTPIYLARLGLAEETLEAARGMLRANQGFANGFVAEASEPGSIVEQPPQWYRVRNTLNDQVSLLHPDEFIHFDFESQPIIAQAINDALLQSHEGVIRVCPAYDIATGVRFRLFAEGGFAVGAEFRQEGFAVTVESLRGEPCYLTLPEGCDAVYAYAAPSDGAFAPLPLQKITLGGDENDARSLSDCKPGDAGSLSECKPGDAGSLSDCKPGDAESMSDSKPGEAESMSGFKPGDAGSWPESKPGEQVWDLSGLKPGDTALLCSCPLEELMTETPAPCAPNSDMKQMDNVYLGAPRLMR